MTSDDWADRQIWTNANAGEVMPDVVTPMTWSVVGPLAERITGTFIEAVGIDLRGHSLFGVVAGRLYFNVNVVNGMLRRIPAIFGIRDISDIFGGQQNASDGHGAIELVDEDVPRIGFKLLWALTRLPPLVVRLLLFTPVRGWRVVQKLRSRSKALDALPLDRLDAPALTAQVQSTFRELLGDTDAFLLGGIANALPSALYGLCRKHFAEKGHPLASQLMAGLGDAESAEAGHALWELARQAHARPALEQALLAASSVAELHELLDGLDGGAEFRAAWAEFMRLHGHHCRGEIELMNPRWAEQPDKILQQVQSYLRELELHDFSAARTRTALGRDMAETVALQRLRGALTRWRFLFSLRKARAAAPFRETVKSQQVRQLAAIRRMLLALGERLASQGRLAAQDDIFFLEVDELDAVLASPAGSASARVEERRAEYRRNLELRHPPVVRGRFDAATASPPPPDQSLRELRGIACNPGVVTGRARVIKRAGDDQVERGEILVAPFTDPGWTPYFINAAAIVMDLGGVLSHGSIVASEYGIPAVVNVGPATEIIRTGQLLRVDGAKGTVEILDEPTTDAPQSDGTRAAAGVNRRRICAGDERGRPTPPRSK